MPAKKKSEPVQVVQSDENESVLAELTEEMVEVSPIIPEIQEVTVSSAAPTKLVKVYGLMTRTSKIGRTVYSITKGKYSQLPDSIATILQKAGVVAKQ